MSDRDNGSFEERLRAAQARRVASEPKPATGNAAEPNAMGIGLRVGIELVSALAVGVAIGWGLDWALGTRPWMLALFVLIGGGAGVANVWRLMMPHGSRRKPGP